MKINSRWTSEFVILRIQNCVSYVDSHMIIDVLSQMFNMATRKRHWTREETLTLISVWGDSKFQNQFDKTIHNHKVWESVWREACQLCPSIEETFDWVKCKERIDYLKRRYREAIKNNKKSGTDPQHSPYFFEMDVVLGKQCYAFFIMQQPN